MSNIYKTVRTTALRFLSAFDHYGTCLRCGVSWKYREPQRVKYDTRGGWAFPLCEQCFREVDPVIATRYFKKLYVGEWGREPDREAFQTFLRNATEIRLEGEGEIEINDPRELWEWSDV